MSITIKSRGPVEGNRSCLLCFCSPGGFVCMRVPSYCSLDIAGYVAPLKLLSYSVVRSPVDGVSY